MDVTGPVGQRAVGMAGAAQQFPHIRRRRRHPHIRSVGTTERYDGGGRVCGTV